MPSIAEIINIGRTSAYLATADNAKNVVTNNVVDFRLPQLLSIETETIQWLYSIAPNDATLINTTNYLYQLCGKYVSKAAVMVSTGSAGSIGVVGGGIGGFAYAAPQFIIATQSTSFTSSTLVGGKDMSVVFVDNIPVSDFTYNSLTGTITFVSVTLFAGNILITPFNKKL